MSVENGLQEYNGRCVFLNGMWYLQVKKDLWIDIIHLASIVFKSLNSKKIKTSFNCEQALIEADSTGNQILTYQETSFGWQVDHGMLLTHINTVARVLYNIFVRIKVKPGLHFSITANPLPNEPIHYIAMLDSSDSVNGIFIPKPDRDNNRICKARNIFEACVYLKGDKCFKFTPIGLECFETRSGIAGTCLLKALV